MLYIIKHANTTIYQYIKYWSKDKIYVVFDMMDVNVWKEKEIEEELKSETEFNLNHRGYVEYFLTLKLIIQRKENIAVIWTIHLFKKYNIN